MASRAEVEAVTTCPAASRMAHFNVTTWGSSSTQRILAIGGSLDPGALIRVCCAQGEIGCTCRRASPITKSFPDSWYRWRPSIQIEYGWQLPWRHQNLLL